MMRSSSQNRAVSVVLTCFNLENYIAEAIESVLGQDFDGEIEVIVVDDCSTDNSAEIIKNYQQVSYIRTELNGGVLLATIAGIEAANHDLISFLDGDDIWEPGKLAAVVVEFTQDPRLAFVTHDFCYADERGVPFDRATLPSKKLTPVPHKEQCAAVRSGILQLSDHVWLGSAMTIRPSISDVSGFCAWVRTLPDAKNIYQDWPLAFWIAAKDEAFLGYVPEKLFRYRLHGANHSGDLSSIVKAERNLRRTSNTIAAMKAIAESKGCAPTIVTNMERRQRSIDYLIALTSGQRGLAVRNFVRSLPDLAGRGLVAKELARLVGVLVLGPERFLRLSNRRRLFRFLRPT